MNVSEPRTLPEWTAQLLSDIAHVTHEQISRFAKPPDSAREAAVLVLLRDVGQGPETLLLTRSPALKAHAGQVAFPGGSVDADDEDIVATALREAAEETTLHSAVLHPHLIWPKLWIPVSGFAVTPVFAWCSHNGAIERRHDDDEVVQVHSVTLAALSNPAHRSRVRYPNGAHGPAVDVDGLFVWGFTALVLDRLLHFTGFEEPWSSQLDIVLPSATPSPPDSLGPAVEDEVSP